MRQKIRWDFEIRTDQRIPARRLDLHMINKKRTCRVIDFAVQADHRVKIKAREKSDKYLYLTRELRKWRWYQLQLGHLEHFPKVCKEYRNSWKSVNEPRPSRQQRYGDRLEYWEEFWRSEETCCHSDSREIPSANACVKIHTKWPENTYKEETSRKNLNHYS